MNTYKKRYRIKSRSRFTVSLIFTVLLITATIGLAFGSNQVTGLSKQNYIQVEVKAGDTLWNIAGKYIPTQDPRKSVYVICQLNNISADQLQPGQNLKIPVDL